MNGQNHGMISRRTSAFFLFLLTNVVAGLGAGSTSLHAQAAPAALKSPLSLTVGGMVSGFDPKYGPNKLLGIGAYADLNVFHGLGIEGEGRWLRYHSFENITQDNYLIGPRYKLLHFWKAQPYVKGLVGFSNMNFEDNVATGRFTDIAFGGGVDVKVTRRFSVRGDAEYQYWPSFLGTSLSPYGASVGVGYRIF
jgi:hypothetical protein